MRKVIVDYKKLTPEILSKLTERFPDGYGDNDIIKFDNHRNETIEAVEVKTEDTIYLVKVSSKLHYTMVNFETNDDLELNSSGHIVVDYPDHINTTFDKELKLNDEEEE
ncbi:conserved hypothetical protein [Formosa agariphila KMM 3901]|uniref:Uncharacterized protein n=1 Tax=Formosa agariphila (strain DSM 15362 / KCTC 12365 / LMG 23005 / KMM 3901 / M-2Alg 35-1) TaxID=1347342 RepID=T2KMF2_FORAG|nr:hypothetical protein [Formosa agariphila]CDF79169.1 conserved hypothetical protein [Formosa agariphila KMM 3901]